ncbi:MAG: hypothetical protein QXP04_04940 [Candidatus Nanoarchaeia archaeon]|nr:hypothetical protein [Candidatus Jingweiarchaeum tengchongense]MCW1310009.1 hypothetical protein [Candidatus Jingweiarchaeum tengchongense]
MVMKRTLGVYKISNERSVFKPPYGKMEVMTPKFFYYVSKFTVQYFPRGTFNAVKIVEKPIEIGWRDFYVDYFPEFSGPIVGSIFKRIKQEAEKENFYRVLGISPMMLWKKTSQGEYTNLFHGTSNSKIGLSSVASLWDGESLDELILKVSNNCAHELGHTFGLEHHIDCLMDTERDRFNSRFCDECKNKIISLLSH